MAEMKPKSDRLDKAYLAGYEYPAAFLAIVPTFKTAIEKGQWLEGRADALREYLAGWDNAAAAYNRGRQ